MKNPDPFGQSIDDIIGLLNCQQSTAPQTNDKMGMSNQMRTEETQEYDILNQFDQNLNSAKFQNDPTPPSRNRGSNSFIGINMNLNFTEEQSVTLKTQSNISTKENSENSKFVFDQYDTLIEFCNQQDSSSQRNVTSGIQKLGSLREEESNQKDNIGQNSFMAVQQTQVRYLQFKPWSGENIKDIQDQGYYFQMTGGPVKLIVGVLEENGFQESVDNDWTVHWCVGPVKMEVYQSMMAYQRINHFPKSSEITRKDLMHRNVSQMQIRFGFANFNFIPKTYILPSQTQLFLEDAEQNAKTQIWYISKPAASSQGKGIFVTDKPQEKQSPQGNVISHYIANPLLINELKFDLRIYVGITSINPLRIYIYEDGLTRFATHEYNVDSLSKGDKFCHLTNYSVNQDSEAFVANTDAHDDFSGSKWSLLALKDFLQLNNINYELIFERMEDLIIKTIISSENLVFSAFEMNVPYTNNCFEVLGFDVLIDSNLKPWLLEVNLSPSMNTDSPLDLKIQGEMISDLLTMVGVVPLDQRYTIDTSYAHTCNSTLSDRQLANKVQNINNWNTYKKQLTKQQRFIIRESDEELKRARKFKRIYPTENAFKYQSYFDVDRPFNILLRNHEMDQFRSNQANHSQNYHKVTSNPLSHKIINSNSTNISGLNSTFVPTNFGTTITNNPITHNNLTSSSQPPIKSNYYGSNLNQL